MAELPKVVKIGPAVYTIRVDNERCEDDGVEGMTSGNYHRIVIRGDRPQLAMADTLLHELIHAVLFTAGASRLHEHAAEGVDLEERYVLAMSSGLLGVFRDNPALVAFLLADPS